VFQKTDKFALGLDFHYLSFWANFTVSYPSTGTPTPISFALHGTSSWSFELHWRAKSDGN